jgi:hypothetical protein
VRPCFGTLSEALGFLAAHLEAGEPGAIAAACDPPPEGASGERLSAWLRHQEWALERLAEAHTQQDLRERYSGREFPARAGEFKLGGHDAELGHLHLDYRCTPEGWVLQKIWICR